MSEWLALGTIGVLAALSGVRQGSAKRSREAETVRSVQRALTPELVREDQKGDGKGPMAGHCYVASQATWHLLGGKRSRWYPVSATRNGTTHWWLEDSSGAKLNPTAAQFPNGFPYETGQRRGFLTSKPSKRAKVVMGRVRKGSASLRRRKKEEGRRKGSRSELSKVRLEKGTLLYHGTQADEDFEFPDGPAWFSTSSDVAENFVRWNPTEAGRHRILVYEVVVAVEDLALVESPGDMEALAQEVGDDGYGTRELAQSVCDAGYDGWHIPWNYPSGSDTLLCDPEEWLAFVEEIEIER